MPTEEEADEALHWLIDNVDEAAQATAEKVYVEEYRKVIKAQLMKEHAKETAVVQEREAYADQRYIDHLSAIYQAIKNESRMRFMREAKRAIIESWRTGSANTRVQI